MFIIQCKIKSVNIEILHCCINKSCYQRLTIIPGNRVVTCQHCGIAIRADKGVKEFQCIITIDKGNQLLLPLDVLENFFGKSVVIKVVFGRRRCFEGKTDFP